MAQQGEEAGFRVVDRRRFREDSEPAEGAAPEPSPPEGGAASPSGAGAPSHAAGGAEPSEQAAARHAAGGAQPSEQAAPHHAAGGAEPLEQAAPHHAAGGAQAGATSPSLPPADFATLVQMLALNALDALGATPGPEGRARDSVDLPLARHCIDLLGVLAGKSRGNLTAEESRLLDQTLFDLRMLVVRASRARP